MATLSRQETKEKAIQLLQKTTVADLAVPGYIASVRDTDSVLDVFKVLVSCRVLGVPVFNTESKRFNGIVDMIDIICFALKVEDAQLKHLMQTSETTKMFEETKCAQIARISHEPYLELLNSVDLIGAINVLVTAYDYLGVHRVLVTNSTGAPLAILSQSKVVSFLAKNIGLFDFAAKTIQDLNIGFVKVLSISSDQPIKDAFQLIKRHKVGAVGVVDNEGKLVGNVSASDLKLIGFDTTLFGKMALPVKQVYADTSKHSYPICVRPDTKIKKVVTMIVEKTVHRVYIVDEHKKPIGVIGLIDILKLVSQYCSLKDNHPVLFTYL